MLRADESFRVTIDLPRRTMAGEMAEMSHQTLLRVMVVDDEAPARALIEEYLSEIAGCELIASCADGFEAVRVAGEVAPDLMILDVQMPKLDGFDVLELLAEPPAVIFSTAYEEHALRAFEVAAVDYLLKPFSQQRLREAIERLRERLASGQQTDLSALTDSTRTKPARRVLVRDGSKIHVVPQSRDQVHRVSGRLRQDQDRRRGAAQEADADEPAGAAGSRALRPCPPLLPGQRRSPRPARALLEGESTRRADRREPHPCESFGLRQTSRAALTDRSPASCQHSEIDVAVTGADAVRAAHTDADGVPAAVVADIGRVVAQDILLAQLGHDLAGTRTARHSPG